MIATVLGVNRQTALRYPATSRSMRSYEFVNRAGEQFRIGGHRSVGRPAAGPVFLAGAPVRGGLIATAPDLANLDNGDLKFVVDFRDVYATLLRRWLNVNPAPVLGRRNEDVAVF